MLEGLAAPMDDAPAPPVRTATKRFVNLGSGRQGSAWIPPIFADWRELRVDVDPSVAPDILADVTDLSAIESGSVDAVWSSHCLEHLFLYQVSQAVKEAYRILADDGFLCLLVPDLQAVAEYIASDRLHEVVYESAAGPVIAHDMLFGYGPYVEKGRPSMAHRCGFTPTLLLQKLQEAPFAEIVLRRRPNRQELAAIACKRPAPDDAAREAFILAVGL